VRYLISIFLALGIGITFTNAPLPGGPSFCNYRDGTVMNFTGAPCPSQPYWEKRR
jgi:hypothetical protein